MSETILDLSHQVAIITGGGTGIGQAIAIELARAGADITICSRDPAHLEATAHEIRALNRKCLTIPTDVRQPDQIENMVRKTLDEFSRIDILVNNAGANFLVPAEEMSLNAWNVIVNINLTGTFLCCKTVYETMVKQKGGKIVNISSVSGRDGRPSAAHYGAAKAGVINLTKSLAAAWGKHGIRINCVAPGPIVTAGARWKEQPEDAALDSGLRRPGQPQEVAYAVLFLVSDGASYISGVELDVDGGVHLVRMR